MKKLALFILIAFPFFASASLFNTSDWIGTNALGRTNLSDFASGTGLATNRPTYFTSDNPTNQYYSRVVYTNAGAKGTLRGWSSGTILNHTNSGVNYPLPVTNNFSEPLSTNDTFQFMTGTVTNAVIWR